AGRDAHDRQHHRRGSIRRGRSDGADDSLPAHRPDGGGEVQAPDAGFCGLFLSRSGRRDGRGWDAPAVAVWSEVYAVVANVAAISVYVLVLAAEWLHARRVRRIAHLAFGPNAAPRAWVW